jgi:DinB superfamily
MESSDPRYPIGRFQPEVGLSDSRREELISAIEALPLRLQEAVAGLSEKEWATPYREGGWAVRQLVHHIADSHMNAYVRFRLALTEDTPTIKPYLEGRWAELPDVATTPPEVSLVLLEALHRRWVDLLRALPTESFQREVYHPEMEKKLTLEFLLGLYAWHCRHHVAHIETLRERLSQQQSLPLA